MQTVQGAEGSKANSARAGDRYPLYAEQVSHLYRNLPVWLLATSMNSLILVFVQRKVISHKVLILWLTSVVLITLFRYIQLSRFRRVSFRSSDASRWGTEFITGATLSGMAWGFSGIFLFPAESIVNQTFLAFVIGGMVAGAAATYAIVMKAFFAYSLPALAPLTIRLLLMGDEIHITMGGMAIIYGVMILLVAMRVNAMTTASLKLRFENSTLLSYLTLEKEQSEELNKKLLLEIAERRKAEQELKAHRDHLEQMVEERTQKWSYANAQLENEITERELSEEALRESERRFRNLVELTSDWIWEVNERLEYTYVSPQVLHILGYEPAEVIGKVPFDLMPREESEHLKETVWQIVAQRLPFHGLENINQHRDGHMVILETGGVPIFDSDKKFRGYRGIDRDITKRKKLEEDLLRVQKLDSLGVLAGGIAHDFNNLLAGILGNLSLAKLSLTQEDKAYKKLEEAEKAVERATGLTQQLLTFSKGGAPLKKVVSVAQLLVDSSTFALRGSNVRCEFSIPDDLWPAAIDEGQISQVVSNLTINADQSMPEGGMISIRAENTTIGPENLLLLKEGRYIKVSIEDRGIGISEEYLQRIFDPYFTTKEKGRGLGLATAYSIVKNHEGHIAVGSKLRLGTIFHIYLPASEDVLPQEEKAEERTSMGKGRVLVMDDEEMIRDMAGDMLERLGYEVEFAREGEEATRQYRKAWESNQPFDVVIMDLTVPGGMGGKEAMEKLLEIDPDVKVIVSSGYSNDPVMANFGEYGFRGVLTKPYRLREMSEALQRITTV